MQNLQRRPLFGFTLNSDDPVHTGTSTSLLSEHSTSSLCLTDNKLPRQTRASRIYYVVHNTANIPASPQYLIRTRIIALPRGTGSRADK
jgi:hypothetical protein